MGREVGNVWASVEVVEWKYSKAIETKIGRGHPTLLNVTTWEREYGSNGSNTDQIE
jgi:nitrate reductase beta subunit